jgi:hypothetical protein
MVEAQTKNAFSAKGWVRLQTYAYLMVELPELEPPSLHAISQEQLFWQTWAPVMDRTGTVSELA